jgi:hypothetical protein
VRLFSAEVNVFLVVRLAMLAVAGSKRFVLASGPVLNGPAPEVEGVEIRALVFGRCLCT